MKAERAGVEALPVRVRLADGEDVTSYAARLAAANALSVHEIETALRPRGLLTSTSPRQPGRLQTWRELGRLHASAFTAPVEIDQTWVTSRPLCLVCTRGVQAMGRHPGTGWVCLRHRRWLGTPQHDISHLLQVVQAERTFRRRLVPRSVLYDTPAMLFALHLALLSTSPAPGRQIAGRWEPIATRYPAQVDWALTLTDQSFLDALSHPTCVQTRQDAISRATDDLHVDQAWRVRSRLHRLSEVLRRVRTSSANPTLPGLEEPAPRPGPADVFLSAI